MVQESLMWSYIVQLSSALRAIHSAGMAARTVDPSKIIVFDKTKQVFHGFLTAFPVLTLKFNRIFSRCGDIICEATISN